MREWNHRPGRMQKIVARTSAYQKANLEQTRAYKSAYKKRNPDKCAAHARAGYWRRPEVFRARTKAWKAAHPEYRRFNDRNRRVRELNSPGRHTEAEWQAIKDKQRGRCAHCLSSAELTRDHIVPLKKGGCNYAFNIQGLCARCNSIKHDHLEEGSNFSLFDRVAS